ncbi:MAG: 8-oxo-dGTP diphosphatase [Alkalispirochaeta sp.]
MARNDKLDETFWATYTPQDRAVLCFLRGKNRVLLIRKKRGLGAGKINGPGGKTESGERPVEAAIRETREEVGLEPLDPIHYGTLRFAFTDGYNLEVYIYVASRWHGTLTDTDEAEPFWVAESDIPYDRMWADDRWWLPAVLAGDHVEAEMAFDGDRMITWNIRFASGIRLTSTP